MTACLICKDFRNGLFMVAIALAVIIGMLAGAEAANKPGDTYLAKAYCRYERYARTLADEMAKDGLLGYVRYIDRDEVECYDAHRHEGIPAVRSILVKKLWEIRMPGPAGAMLEFWLARAKDGGFGYVWLPK